MPADHETHRSFAKHLSPEEADLYLRMLGRIDALPPDDEMRLFVNVLGLYTHTALRSADSSAERIEKAKQEIERMLAKTFAKQARMEELLASQIERLDEAHRLELSVVDTFREEFDSFLGRLPSKGLQAFIREADRGKNVFKEINDLSRHFRDTMPVIMPRVQALTNQLNNVVQQVERATRQPTASVWQRHWIALAGTIILLTSIGLAFWVGRYTATA